MSADHSAAMERLVAALVRLLAAAWREHEHQPAPSEAEGSPDRTRPKQTQEKATSGANS